MVRVNIRGHDDQEIGQVRHGGLIQKQVDEEAAALDAQRPLEGHHQAGLDQLAAGSEIDPVDESSQSRGKDVDGHPVDDLLGAQADRRVGKDHVYVDPGQRARQNAQEGISGDQTDKKAREGANRGDPFNADVDQPRAL